MIKEYGQAGNVEQVWALWSEMEERGVKPTAIAFGCTVDPLVENGCVHMRGTTCGQLVNTVIYYDPQGFCNIEADATRLRNSC